MIMNVLKKKKWILLVLVGLFMSLLLASCETCENPPACENGQLNNCKCICEECWTGTLCQNRIENCITCSPDCGPYGTCNTNTGTCECDNNYSGPTCQTFTDPCPNTICVNGKKDYSNCSCNCYNGWTGNDCSEQVPSATSYLPDDINDICPLHIGGDREFSGNGPVVNISCEAFILNEKDIYVHVYFHVKETKSDWTEGLYEGDIKIYTAPSGKKINSIISATSSTANYVDTDHSFDVPTVQGALVDRFEAIGDTSGKDLGGCNNNADAELNIYFNPMTVELVDE